MDSGTPPGAKQESGKREGPDAGNARPTRLAAMLVAALSVAALGLALVVFVRGDLPLDGTASSSTGEGPGALNAEGCATLDACLSEASAALQAGRYADAIDAYERAQSFVPEDQHSRYARLWCDLSQANLALEQDEQAYANFQTCIEWAREGASEAAPGLQAGGQGGGDTAGHFADRVVDFRPGVGAEPACADPSAALGPPDFDIDQPSTFVCLGANGTVQLEFVDVNVVNGPGTDLRVYGDPANDEGWRLEISEDGEVWASYGIQPEVVEVDLAAVGLARARFLRLTDAGYGAGGASDGAELDAVEALHWEAPE